MKEWDVQIDQIKWIELLIGIGLLLLFFSMYQQLPLLFFVAVLVIIYANATTYYLKHVGDKIFIDNNKQTDRMFPGDKGGITIKMRHAGNLPIFKGKMKVIVDNYITSSTVDHEPQEFKETLDFIIPFRIMPGETVNVTIPIEGSRRGVARIRALDVTVDHFFGFGQTHLHYRKFWLQEWVVYPTALPVLGADKLDNFNFQGVQPVHSSLYEDITTPIGTRDYTYSDPFNRIHWKASARMQSLQTKQFERTALVAWSFVINIRKTTNDYYLGAIENLEEILSNVTYMCQIAVKRNVSFELFINVQTVGTGPMLHLPLGSGKEHLIKALELLARVQKNGVSISSTRMLHYIEHYYRISPVLILCGEKDDSNQMFMKRIKKNGVQIFHLVDQEGEAFVKEIR